MKLAFVTRNERKFAEAKLVLLNIELVQVHTELTEIQGEPEAIIQHKIAEAAAHAEAPFFVEDTFLKFDALNGLPGPYINDFLKKLGPVNLYKLLDGFKNKQATAAVLVGLHMEDGATHIFEGSIRGTIVPPRGTVAFGWDPIFQPEGYDKTFAEMGVEGKSKISHRAKALEKLKTFVEVARKH